MASIAASRVASRRVAGLCQADADEGLAGAGQRVPERLHDGYVGRCRTGEVSGEHGGVVEREMDDGVRVDCGLAQAGRVAQVAALRLGTHGLDGGGRGVGSRQAYDLVSALDQFRHYSRGDVAAGAGDEDTHE